MAINFTNPEFLTITGIIVCGLTISVIWAVNALLRERRRNLILSLTQEQHQNLVISLEQTIERLRMERTNLFTENRDLSGKLSALQTTLAESGKKAEEWNELFKSTRDQMEKDFQILAEKIFAQKSRTISDSHQDGLKNLLQPVREQLGEFKKKVEDVHAQESRDRIILVNEIEHLKKLNLQISEDAVNLTSALKGKSKVQGLWGEMVLERLLEDSGLKKGHEYETQVPLKDRNGSTRFPDVLVRLPEDRVVIIDAKVSLKAFEQACRAEKTDKETKYLQQHLDSLKKHISGLADKKYHLLEGINSPDFIVLFIPTEGAFQAAVTYDPAIITAAMRKKIILGSPSTLLALLKIIHHMWRQDEQNRNSLAIAKQAGNLYDKFMGFIEVFEEIGTRLKQSHDSWEVARKRLSQGRGNLISRAETLKDLGIQNSKTLPQSFHAEQEKQGSHETTHQG
ncbi:MAG: DNA recombination protein RmuC [Desulfobulbaceae bacterium]|nr:DNA recombination protein RmuC [Desulfobulbaceae bacterium]